LRPRIYLAGPEVFLPEARAVGRLKVELCAAAGFEGAFPLDHGIDLAALPKQEQGLSIQRACEAVMRTCDLAIANMTPFRGVSMDVGTAYEMGFMRALGRPVLGYSNVVADLEARCRAFRARGIPPGDSDRPDVEIEDFDAADNLMMAVAVVDSGSRVHTHAAQAGAEMTDLTAFARCLADARRLFASVIGA
jgi:nucleoside 2-deoxyribosyltransferase